jgi:alpha-tubulin suppressor-like RCC1 family protein
MGARAVRIAVGLAVATIVMAVPAGSSQGAPAPRVVSAWGDNGYGELGNGTTTTSVGGVGVHGLSSIKAIAAGASDGLAVTAADTVVAWGDNNYGELGTGSDVGPSTCPATGTACSDVPVTVSSLKDVRAIAAGGDFSLALLGNGTVMSWGMNNSGELGDGSTSGPQSCTFGHPCSPTPVRVHGLRDVIAIAAGGEHALALLAGGTVMAWGNDTVGELGPTTAVQTCADGYPCSPTPVAVGGLHTVKAIAADRNGFGTGGDFNLALLADGRVMAWGSNDRGQLGDGSTTGPQSCGAFGPCSNTPAPVSGLRSVTAVAAGGHHGMALLADHSVKAWGENSYGQLGDGQYLDSAIPVAVSHLARVATIAAGWEHSLALRTDGKVEQWGQNWGDGTPTDVPTAVTGLSPMATISAGQLFSLAGS